MLVKQAVSTAQRDEPIISPLVAISSYQHLLRVALLGPEPGLEEAGKNVVISVCALLSSVLPDASKAGHGAEAPAPLLMMEKLLGYRNSLSPEQG